MSKKAKAGFTLLSVFGPSRSHRKLCAMLLLVCLTYVYTHFGRLGLGTRVRSHVQRDASSSSVQLAEVAVLGKEDAAGVYTDEPVEKRSLGVDKETPETADDSQGNRLAAQEINRDVRLNNGPQTTAHNPDGGINQPRGVLIGVFSVASHFERRSLIRTTYMRMTRRDRDEQDYPQRKSSKSSGSAKRALHRRFARNATVVFVVGQPVNSAELHLLWSERDTHGDILILPCEENMDEGKTFEYFKHVYEVYGPGQSGQISRGTRARTADGPGNSDSGAQGELSSARPAIPYRFVVKTDEDTWVHVANLEAKLDSLPNRGTYFGRAVCVGARTGSDCFMAGLGYALSWDLVEFIATDPTVAHNTVGQEDALVSEWFYQQNVMHHHVTDEVDIYDTPDLGKGIGWSKPYTPHTVFVHQCKRRDWFIRTSHHFLADSA
ncbi:hypothetical protein SARC_08996 [Sphaeroforma arctica JP610]|uniref:Hexosyltransferase n=1 Tax=Sphaeroforma arctica JP610 TaxID=667725 RepID=A0A0L0FPF1_9EUKA|nr:hypothetical protein SARC_08996 [Sphaeroforma arctica JP610]KNC78579.1 hypothetical protein SARC_08996 [Sphaeroforma arctica JP610]|eukprot:XP_014152481.1 hypothetical protein SARC_08996 [Sphaeroforma arctica JP610]